MALLIQKVSSDFQNIDQLSKLNREAFPKEERMEIHEMLLLIEKHKLEVSAIYDDDIFIGFYALHVRKPIAYIFFIAVDESKRSQGYGSQMIQAMTQQYHNFQIVLDMEAMDEHADNSQQRKKRKEFYLRNGFHETGYYLMFHQILMEIVCNKDELDVSGFQELLNKMEIRNTSFQIFHKKEI